ncbi:NAD-dependent epimerase/dehydratase family protein [Roseomonas stagni]|uniref:NAD-dependent epimerase/dehydratase family protein n=1 Tax=Falsiroseomonas algicola TaxID=2716930 RepID=A0A6M1LI24_9PROT|nr:NAD-dependent epimerase/dehydratase family protein [Falsiroseomonas algicola]NGM19649.1 NAD-dependent epimerase/dehydratase family protein [Falsiroseomonas algicola]
MCSAGRRSCVARTSRLNSVLVTGAAGFLGGCIATALERSGAHVTRFDRVAAPGVVAGDIARIAEAFPPGTRFGAVIHAAAITTQASEADPDEAWAINVEGTRAALRFAQGARFVLLSSIGVFGGGEAEPDEASPPRPASTYGMTKLVAEALLADASRRGDADGVVLRLPISVLRTTRSGPPGAGFISDLVAHARRGARFTAPLGPDHALPIASVRAGVAMACRAALARDLPARLLHVPSLAVSGAVAVAALDAEGVPARALVDFAPDPAVEALVSGWPRRLVTRFPAFSADLADPDFRAILRPAAA